MSAAPPSADSLLDRPEVLACLFYPRPGFAQDSPANARDLAIPVPEIVNPVLECLIAVLEDE